MEEPTGFPSRKRRFYQNEAVLDGERHKPMDTEDSKNESSDR
jgi:hypothetical protein